jgi:drug/metabolite transporter (DMT)-like permease
MKLLKNWIFYALCTFVFFGVTNFILGYIAEVNPSGHGGNITAAMILWVGMGCMGVISAARFLVRYRSIPGIQAKKYIVFSAVAGVSLAIAMLSLKVGMAADPLSKGPIVAITSVNSLLVAFLAHLILKESLNKFHLWGMLVSVGGIVVMVLGDMSTAGLLGILFGLLTMSLFSFTNFILKWLGHNGNDSIAVVTILWLSAGSFGALALGYRFFTGQNMLGLEQTNLQLLALGAGILLGMGMLTLKLGVSHGPAGPVVAIASSNAILVALLDRLLLGHLPAPLKLAGMLAAVLGIVIIAMGSWLLPAGQEADGTH